MVARSARQAAEALSDEGVECTVVDLRSLVPLDLETLASSVRATGRAVVVHEAPLTLGMGAEIVARLMEDCFDALEAPVLRVTGYDTPYPPATVEKHYLPSAIGSSTRSCGRWSTRWPSGVPAAGPRRGPRGGRDQQWRVAEGDVVELNQPLVDVDTAKALRRPLAVRRPGHPTARGRGRRGLRLASRW